VTTERRLALLACLMLTGCGFGGQPKYPGVYTCTVAGQKVTFDSRDYDWTIYSDYGVGTHKRDGSTVVLPAGPGDCLRTGT
jgi:hypothetical protein